MRQTWPPQPAAPEGPSTTRQRMLWCHSSSTFTLPLAGMAAVMWASVGLATRGMRYHGPVLAALALLPLALGAAGGSAVWRSWREAVLGRDGEAAVGEVVRLREGRGSSPIITAYHIDYRFEAADGRTYTGSLRTTRSLHWAFYRGEPVEVRYDRGRPGRSTLRYV